MLRLLRLLGWILGQPITPRHADPQALDAWRSQRRLRQQQEEQAVRLEALEVERQVALHARYHEESDHET